MEKRAATVLELWRTAGGQPLAIPLEGRSMAPLALPGDRVTIEPAEPEALRCGDIVALLGDEALVIHRFLGLRGTRQGIHLCQQGDNAVSRSWVSAELLVGRATLIEGPQRRLDLTASPWTWLNPLIGRLVRWHLVPAGPLRRGLISLILRIAS